jgi:hypothetical protein
MTISHFSYKITPSHILVTLSARQCLSHSQREANYIPTIPLCYLVPIYLDTLLDAIQRELSLLSLATTCIETTVARPRLQKRSPLNSVYSYISI